MDSIRHINYKSDFIIRERFRDASGAFVAIPQEVDFELRYWVKPGRQFIASRIGGEYTNCTQTATPSWSFSRITAFARAS